MDARRHRAVEEPLDARLRSVDAYPVLEVRNPLHGTAYLVLLPLFPSSEAALCTCTDFARRGLGTCKHIEAGFRWLRDHPNARPPASPERAPRSRSRLWREIDRRLSVRAQDTVPESLAWRSAGRVLFERSGSA